MKSALSYVGVFLVSALGMLLGNWLAPLLRLEIPDVWAQNVATFDVLSTRQFELMDTGGRRRGLISTGDRGAPGVWFFDQNGKARLNLGLYDDGNAYVVLNDENEQAVELFRTVGDKQSPVLVLKSQGKDRIVMGLNFNGEQDPFLVHYDAQGKKTPVFGNY